MSGRHASVCAIDVMVPHQSTFCKNKQTVFPMYGDLRIGSVRCLLLALWAKWSRELDRVYKRRGKHKSLPLLFMSKWQTGVRLKQKGACRDRNTHYIRDGEHRRPTPHFPTRRPLGIWRRPSKDVCTSGHRPTNTHSINMTFGLSSSGRKGGMLQAGNNVWNH